jgi:hypothetical protein
MDLNDNSNSQHPYEHHEATQTVPTDRLSTTKKKSKMSKHNLVSTKQKAMKTINIRTI